MRAGALVAAAVVLAAGCGGPKNFEDFRHQLDSRWCDYQVRCGQIGKSEPRHCAIPAPLAGLGPVGFDLDAAIGRNSMQFHPGNAQDCLDAVGRASCDPRQAALTFDRFCHGIATALLPVGHACLDSAECQGGACVGDGVAAGCGGSCVAWVATYAACDPAAVYPAVVDPTRQCDPTVHFCDASGVCQKKKQPGERCNSDVECAFDWFCVSGHCGDPARLGEGAVCGSDTPPCRDGLWCDQRGACAARQDRGQPCTVSAGCQDGLACIGGSCAAWLDSGLACTADQPGVPSMSGCPASQSCTNQSCQPNGSTPIGPDQPCMSSGDCAAGLVCHSRICVQPAGLGGACSDDASCAAGLRCDTFACKPTLSCAATP